MNTNDIVLAIDAEIAQLQKVKALLTDTDFTTTRKPGRPAAAGAPNRTASFNPVEFTHKRLAGLNPRKVAKKDCIQSCSSIS